MAKYPGYVAVALVQPRDSGLPPLHKGKYMIPEVMNVGNLLIALRQDVEAVMFGPSSTAVMTCVPLELTFSKARFNFSEQVGTIYDKLRGEDGYLVVYISSPHLSKKMR